MPKRKLTLDERERRLAEREAAIAYVLPLISPALTKMADFMREYDAEPERVRWMLAKLHAHARGYQQ